MNFDDIDKLALSLPGVTVATKWGNRTYVVGDASFAWQRPFSKADLKRFGGETPPSGEILALRVDGLDAKEALLAIAPPGFFTIPHFDGYAAILIELRRARARDVRAAVADAYATATRKKTITRKKQVTSSSSGRRPAGTRGSTARRPPARRGA